MMLVMQMRERESVSELKFDPRRVFLVSGQVLEKKVGGRERVSAAVTQRVVHADDGLEAYRRLAEAEPAFQPLGFGSLFDYEDAVRRVREAVEGRSDEWPVVGTASSS